MEQRYTWLELHDFCREVACKIQNDLQSDRVFQNYDLIIGVARGGLIPACILSHLLGNIPVCCISVSSYNSQNKQQTAITHQHIDPVTLTGKKILIVDDLTDSGHTLQTIQEFYKLYDIIARTATIFIKPGAVCKPNFYAKEVLPEDWIVFPYEVES